MQPSLGFQNEKVMYSTIPMNVLVFPSFSRGGKLGSKDWIDTLGGDTVSPDYRYERPVEWLSSWEKPIKDYEKDNLHWVGSSVTFHDSGQIDFKAKHMAAMWRWPGPLDDGPPFHFSIVVTIIPIAGDGTELPMWQRTIEVAFLRYRQPADNVFRTWQVPWVLKMWNYRWKVAVQQKIEKDMAKDAIPIGTITIPWNP